MTHGLLYAREDYRIEAWAALESVEALALEERILAVSTWVGQLRLTANRQGHREDDDSKDVRQTLLTRLVKWWPDESRTELLRQCVSLMEGPIPGGWADSTTNDFLKPLNGAGKITDEEAIGVWVDLLDGRVRALLEGSYQYFGPSDTPLTQVVAQLVAAVGSAETLGPLTRAVRTARNRVMRPFAKARYPDWARARDVLIWAGALARLVVEHAPEASPALPVARAMMDLEEEAQGRMHEDRKHADATGLAAFAEAVRNRKAARS